MINIETHQDANNLQLLSKDYYILSKIVRIANNLLAI